MHYTVCMCLFEDSDYFWDSVTDWKKSTLAGGERKTSRDSLTRLVTLFIYYMHIAQYSI